MAKVEAEAETETKTVEETEEDTGPTGSADIIEADDEAFSDEGIDTVDARSSLTSIASFVLKGVEENGRTYASYGREEYGAPMDEQEMDRIDMAHTKYFILLEHKRFLAPIDPNPQKVLDLACGTGIWSLDFADAHPSAEVSGVDIAPIQPVWTSPNCHFEIDDIEQDWTWKKDSYDYIFARDLLLCIRDLPRLIEQAFDHLRPGGWLEFHCVSGRLSCDDGSLTPDDQLYKYDALLRAAATAFGTPLEDPERYASLFSSTGFANVTERVFKVPVSPWAKDPRLRMVGAFEQENLCGNLEAISMRVFQKGLGWGVDEAGVFFAAVRKDIRSRKVHAYWPFHVVYGQKPLGPGTSS